MWHTTISAFHFGFHSFLSAGCFCFRVEVYRMGKKEKNLHFLAIWDFHFAIWYAWGIQHQLKLKQLAMPSKMHIHKFHVFIVFHANFKIFFFSFCFVGYSLSLARWKKNSIIVSSHRKHHELYFLWFPSWSCQNSRFSTFALSLSHSLFLIWLNSIWFLCSLTAIAFLSLLL